MADNDILQGFQVGFQSSMRMQELRSQAALRKLQEQAAAQEIQMNIEKNNLAIQYRADMTKAISAAHTASSPKITVPMMGQEGLGDMAPPVMEVDNPNALTKEQAAFRFIVPVVAKYQPDKVPDVLEGIALAEHRRNAEGSGPAQIQTITGPDGRQHQVFDPGNKGVRQLVAPAPEITEIDGEQFYQSGPNRFTRIPKDVGQRQKEAFNRQVQKEQLMWVRDNAPQVYSKLFSDAPVDVETGLPIPNAEAIATAAKTAGFQGATKTLMEQQSIGAEKVFSTGRRLLSMINESTVGPGGFWNREIVARIPGMPDTKGMSDAVAAETLAKQFFGDISKAVRTDSNINETEFQSIKAAAPDPTRFLTKPSAEKRRLFEFLISARNISRSNSSRTGKPITPMWRTAQEIDTLYKRGELSIQGATEMWQDSATLMLEQLQSELKL